MKARRERGSGAERREDEGRDPRRIRVERREARHGMSRWMGRERDVPESERENENAANASATRQMPVLEGHACGQKSGEM